MDVGLAKWSVATKSLGPLSGVMETERQKLDGV